MFCSGRVRLSSPCDTRGVVVSFLCSCLEVAFESFQLYKEKGSSPCAMIAGQGLLNVFDLRLKMCNSVLVVKPLSHVVFSFLTASFL